MPGARNYLTLLLSWSLTTWYIEALTSPVIQFEPEQAVYIVGEVITMRCVANNPSTVTGYIFYKDSAATSNSTSSNILTFNLKTSDSGNYFCIYYTNNGSKSSESNFVDLRVLEQPPTPSLFVTPQRHVFIKDQSAVLQCQVPKEQSSAATGITLYQNGRETYESDNFGVLSFSELQIKNTGNYSCDYTVNISGRIIQSQLTKEEVLLVIEKPPMPRLRYAYSQQSQTRQVELVCDVLNSSFSQIHGSRFYRNGIKIESSNQVNHFTFNYTLSFDGCYSCQTSVTLLGEEILSQRSFEQFLSVEGRDQRQCQENTSKDSILSKAGLKLYGSVLAGKIIVLICVLAIFGVYLHVIQQRIKKSVAQAQAQ
ncbi:Fc receptor-like protein 5 [Lithobates pipiens]